MQTQIDQIKAACRAYLVPLNTPRDAMHTWRWACYLDFGTGGELSILWPHDPDDKLTQRLPHQVYSKRRQYPAFHFALAGCGYSKTYEIACTLQAINPRIDVYELGGAYPSLVKGGVI